MGKQNYKVRPDDGRGKRHSRYVVSDTKSPYYSELMNVPCLCPRIPRPLENFMAFDPVLEIIQSSLNKMVGDSPIILRDGMASDYIQTLINSQATHLQVRNVLYIFYSNTRIGICLYLGSVSKTMTARHRFDMHLIGTRTSLASLATEHGMVSRKRRVFGHCRWKQKPGRRATHTYHLAADLISHGQFDIALLIMPTGVSAKAVEHDVLRTMKAGRGMPPLNLLT